MSWNDNKGPWGDGPWKKSGDRDFSKDVDDMMKQLKKILGRNPFGGRGGNGGTSSPKNFLMILGGLLAGVYLVSGLYMVNADEQAVVLRFGRWVRTAEPGLNYRLPAPFESVIKASVAKINRLDSGSAAGRQERVADVDMDDDVMLTGDENIVHIGFAVLWQVRDIRDFIFSSRNPEATVKVAAESAMREIIGQYQIGPIVSGAGWSDINQKTLELLQKMIDDYKIGVRIVNIELQRALPPQAVTDAFSDVQRAKADRERLINEARSYQNDIIPKARGEMEKRIQDAMAYRQSRITMAEGDAQRFLSIYEEYRQAPDVTRRRMYLEAVEKILAQAAVTLVDPDLAGGKGVVPYLPLNELQKKKGSKE